MSDQAAMLATLKSMLGISSASAGDPGENVTTESAEADTMLDKNLTWILTATITRLKLLLGGVDPPDEMEHIIIDVSIIRYNRIGSEGFKSHLVDKESISFLDNDFSGYMDEIEAWMDEQKGTKKGRVRFI